MYLKDAFMQRVYIWSINALPGNQTHDLGIANGMI